MKLNKFWLLSAFLVFVLVLAACGNGGDTGDEGAEEDTGTEEETTEESGTEEDGAEETTDDGGEAEGETPDFLTLLTGGTSGTYYPLGGEMASNISDETGIQTDALSSNASADNIIDLQNGEAELGMVQTDTIAQAVEGEGAFEGDPVDNVLALGALYPETVQIVTTADSGIESVEDLEGMTVSVGAPGSGTFYNAEQILEIHGLSLDDIDAQNLDFGESTGGIQDGNIDAAIITGGTPTGAVEELTATVDVRILPVEQDMIDQLIEQYPFYTEDTVEAGTYGIEEDVTTVAVGAMIAVTDSLSEDVVYDITAAIYENAESMAHARAADITVDTALDGIGIDIHPGAQRYFDEQGVESE
ncbi:TAXI family TRAP transporter solute-binding subunit [Salinicoccus halitifaciens]|uniref:TRAP transporter TAXI family solute receptor n=1 Tax=Salinicoccus halitifaciens TaxID=1073415 RepID=A0ABV2EAT2_9STAP|nr:TAXI family TRAP transporter solute-binding subunit [Salinicoccus halitifaciens]MCD2138028.1 TAXI family TRAP transporter solute-binding subunit [Salinicoccus halitifaciens]